MAGKRYDKAPENLNSILQSVIKEYHQRLTEPTVTVGVEVEAILVYGPRDKNGLQTKEAIIVGGLPAYACIRISRLEERVSGRGDAILWIDGDNWKKWGTPKLRAILDHELTHLELAEDPKTGEIQLDDAGRVKLRLRPHDVEFGWFDEVAERHPKHSVEVAQATTIVNSRQMYFPEFEIAPLTRARRRR